MKCNYIKYDTMNHRIRKNYFAVRNYRSRCFVDLYSQKKNLMFYVHSIVMNTNLVI